MKNKSSIDGQQKGFILITSLIMLSLLTLMTLAMFFSGRSATQTSASAQSSTEAYYYAETAINYISWAFYNDAEFDSFAYTSGSYRHLAFVEPNPPTNGASVGDMTEFNSYLSDPGPTIISDSGNGILGQIMYFDNSSLDSRAICYFSEPDQGVGNETHVDCINVQLAPNDTRLIAAQPTMSNISVSLPRFIKLDIAADGTITSSIPQLPHRGPGDSTPGPVVGEDIPNNGAIVWITAAGTGAQVDSDIQIYPLTINTDPTNPPIVLIGQACTNDVNCPCSGTPPATALACDAAGQWLNGPAVGSPWSPPYSIAAYAIGYVNGQPKHMIRAIIY